MDAENVTKRRQLVPFGQHRSFSTSTVIPGHVAVIIETVNFAVIGSTLALFGIVTNIINLIIFARQGLNNTINISLFALAISDLGNLLLYEWQCLLANPLVYNYSGVPFHYREMIYATAGFPQKCFTRVTSYITVYVTCERLLCIMIPLKVKQIVTPRKTTVIMVSIFVVMWVPILPDYTTFYVDWKFFPEQNRSLIGMKFTETRDIIGPITFLQQAVLSGLSFPVLIVLTFMLVWKLKEKGKWRQRVTADASKAELTTIRDKRIVTMITLIAAINIMCYTPGVILFTACFVVPELSISGKYANAFLSTWSFGFLGEAINSSVNIFLYYTMSTKYRNQFRELFCLQRHNSGRSGVQSEASMTRGFTSNI